jgi:hypothetical protein
MRNWLHDELDLPVSMTSVYRHLEEINWSRKVASKRAKEQSQAYHRVCLARLGQNYTAEQIVAVDVCL